MEQDAKQWLLDVVERLPKFRLCRDTGTRVTEEKCPVHDSTDCVFRYVNVKSILEHA